jgi:DNA repair photolyase
VRWESLQVSPATGGADDALFARPAVVRTFDSPHFAGMTFYEVQARSILNRVPTSSRVPFEWTINPYRGCSHACRYCFARNTHSYLDLDTGIEFDTKIVVKVNAPELLRRELAKPSWRGQPVAMGTNVDCYQRAEGRYRLMPDIIKALTERANPFSILTKGSLILRDLPLLTCAAGVTDVSTALSIGFVDGALWREIEPGTPHPAKRLEVCRTLNAAGVRCGVLMAPILPWLTDSPAQLAATVTAIAEAGAQYVTPIVLHLRPGAREWFMTWLSTARPDLVDRYRQLYSRSAYAPKAYQDDICGQVRDLACSLGLRRPAGTDRAPVRSTGQRSHDSGPDPQASLEQLSLLPVDAAACS